MRQTHSVQIQFPEREKSTPYRCLASQSMPSSLYHVSLGVRAHCPTVVATAIWKSLCQEVVYVVYIAVWMAMHVKW